MSQFHSLAASVSLLLAAGCMSYNVQPYGFFDPSEKTMTVRQGGGGLAGAIKARLRDAGWSLAVDGGPVVSQGTLGASTRIETGVTYRTRYRMNLDAHFEDVAITGGSIFHYDISIIDNRDGTEVLTMAGRGIDREIIARLIEAIQQQTRQVVGA